MRERPPDMEAVSRDDKLLDLLGAGESPDTDDPVIEALYAWREDISAGLNGRSRKTVNGHHAHRVRAAVTPPASEADPGRPGRPRHRRTRRHRFTIATIAVGLSAGLSGVAVAAADAGPDSPLWPITKIIFSETAAERQAEADAEAALDRARRALADGRVEDAKRYLNEANRRAGAVRAGEADRLRDDLDKIRSEIEQEQSRETTAEPSDPPQAPEEEPSDGEDATPAPEAPTPTTSPDGKDSKGRNDPGGKSRQDLNRELDTTSSPEPTSSEITSSPTAL